MDRRDFVERLLVLPVGVFLLRCSGNSYSSNGYSSGGGNGNAPGAAPTVSGSEAVYTSSNVAAHTHTFGIELENFKEPPSNGVSGLTSDNAQHTHTVSVSASDLANVEKGSSVIVTTSSNAGHTHVFTFVRVG
jgi:hypothetical protein